MEGYYPSMEKDLQVFRNSVPQCSKRISRAYPHSDLTSKVIGAAIEVHRIMGPGFLESVSEESLALELDRLLVPYERQRLIRISYRGAAVGCHRIDLVVGGKIVVELKAVKSIDDTHLAVTMAYLKAMDLQVGLVINFGESLARVRRVARGIDGNAEALNNRSTEGV